MNDTLQPIESGIFINGEFVRSRAVEWKDQCWKPLYVGIHLALYGRLPPV